MRYKELEQGRQYRWKRSRGSEIGKVGRSAFAALSLSSRAVRDEWRHSPDDSIVTIVSKKWYAVTAKTASGEFIAVKPENLEPLSPEPE